MKRALPYIMLICLLCTFHAYAQTITRQDKLFIQRGILYESWVRNDHASEAVPVPDRQPLVIGRSGRYVRIQLPNTEILSLAEVQVFSGGVNVALNKNTRQSSNKQPNAGLSPLAVDGNTDGIFTNGSVTHTIEGYAQMEPWWEVDLGSSIAIDSIVIWNRTDCCGSKLKGFFLFVTDNAIVTNTIAATIAQSGVSHYVQPLTGFVPRYPSAAELNNAGISPTYFEIPNYNYTIHQQDSGLYWGIAKGVKPPFPAGVIERGPSAFEQSNGFLNSLEAGNVSKLHSICIGDEEPYSTAMTGYMKGWFDVIRAKYPNVLFHSNQYIGQWSNSQISTYMQTAQPDLLTFDMYYFHYVFGPAPGAGNTYTRMYQDLQVYRQLALGGYDGSGNNPIGFGGYLQAFSGDNTGTYAAYRPSASEFNLNTFAYLTMGAKWLNVWIYYALFWDYNTNQPTPQYYQVANLGKAVAKLSPHLSRLRTSDLRFIPGQNTSGTNASPSNIPAWDTLVDPYVKSITAVNLGTFNNGLKGDVLMGYFKPVPGLDNTAGITMAPVTAMNTHYFMMLNGLTKPNGPGNNSTDTVQGKAAYTRQKITLGIDFGNGPVDTLYRVRRTDGVSEMVPLSAVGGSQYTMTDTLDGGVADLFYWKNQGAPLIPSNGGNSLRLNNGSVSAGAVTALSGAQQFTMEAWVKFNSTTPWSTVFYRNENSNNRIVLSTGNSNSLHVVVSNGQANYANSADNVIAPGQWYHLAVVYDGTQSTDAAKLKLFVNGQQQPLSFGGAVPATAGISSAPLVMGAINQTTGGNYLDGVVDEVRVWNTALLPSTVTTWKNLQPGSCHPNISNLQVYWQLNNSSNAAVATPSLNTTYSGAIVNGNYVQGTWGSGTSSCTVTPHSLQLSNGAVSAGNVTQLNGTNTYTVETWAKFNSIGDWHTIFSKMTDVNNRFLLQMYSSGALYVIVSNGSNNYGQTAANTITTGQWYHIAVVYDGSKSTNAGRLKLYINGNLVPLTFQGTIPATTSTTNSSPLLFGNGCTGCTTNYMDGTLDEIRVWNAPLSAATLTTWKNKQPGDCHPNSSNLQVYWNFNNNPDQTIASPGLHTIYTGIISNGNYGTENQAAGNSGCLGSLQQNEAMMSYQPKNNMPAGNGARIYPNPVSSVLNAEFNSKSGGLATITIFDVNGKAVYSGQQQLVKGFNRIQVNLQEKPPGYYILKLATRQESRQFTVIRQ